MIEVGYEIQIWFNLELNIKIISPFIPRVGEIIKKNNIDYIIKDVCYNLSSSNSKIESVSIYSSKVN